MLQTPHPASRHAGSPHAATLLALPATRPGLSVEASGPGSWSLSLRGFGIHVVEPADGNDQWHAWRKDRPPHKTMIRGRSLHRLLDHLLLLPPPGLEPSDSYSQIIRVIEDPPAPPRGPLVAFLATIAGLLLIAGAAGYALALWQPWRGSL